MIVKQRQQLILSDLETLFGYTINYDLSYDVKNDNNIDCYRVCIINNLKVVFKISYCPKYRTNLGYTNYNVLSYGISFYDEYNIYHSLINVQLNNRSELYNFYNQSPHLLFPNISNKYYDLIYALMQTLNQQSPFFKKLLEIANNDIECFILKEGL